MSNFLWMYTGSLKDQFRNTVLIISPRRFAVIIIIKERRISLFLSLQYEGWRSQTWPKCVFPCHGTLGGQQSVSGDQLEDENPTETAGGARTL